MHWQGPIDWRTVRNSGVSFASIKVTEAGDFSDPMFDEHWRGAQATSVLWGHITIITSVAPPANRPAGSSGMPRKKADLPHALDMEEPPYQILHPVPR